jgi:hypothetical protein
VNLNPGTRLADNIPLKMENGIYQDPTSGKMLPDRRSGIDRRSITRFSSLFDRRPRRRRSRGRRKIDQGAYVDIYDFRTWSIAIAVMILSCIDAFLTRMHLARGSARELNPLLVEVLNHGGFSAFFVAKAAMTAVPLSIIVIHKEWVIGRYAAWLCLWSYVFITCYHLYLIYGLRKVLGLIVGLVA